MLSKPALVRGFPGPDHSIRLEDLRSGTAISRRYRNRRIGEFLKELDLTEGRSTGIPKILRVMKHNGSPLPEFESDDDRTFFLIRLPVHKRTSRIVGEAITTEVTTEVTPGLRLVSILQGEMSRRALQHALGLKNNEHFRKTYLLPALEQGLIAYTIPEKPTSRLQKYRLTETGRNALAGIRQGS